MQVAPDDERNPNAVRKFMAPCAAELIRCTRTGAVRVWVGGGVCVPVMFRVPVVVIVPNRVTVPVLLRDEEMDSDGAVVCVWLCVFVMVEVCVGVGVGGGVVVLVCVAVGVGGGVMVAVGVGNNVRE
jgi:hypothetical protein